MATLAAVAVEPTYLLPLVVLHTHVLPASMRNDVDCHLGASRLRLRGIVPVLPHHIIFGWVAYPLTADVGFRVTSVPRDLRLVLPLAIKDLHLIPDLHFGSSGGGAEIFPYFDRPTHRFVRNLVCFHFLLTPSLLPKVKCKFPVLK